MAEANNNISKDKLLKYKLPEIGEREEGYDGHYDWNNEDETILELTQEFRNIVNSKKEQELSEMIGSLVAGGEDGRLNTICQLLLDSQNSEESLKEALLITITIGSRPLVELILSLYNRHPYLERTGCANSPNFSPHMTPLMLACTLNNYSIVYCLLLRGHCIPVPHFPTCECKSCKRVTVSTRTNIRTVDIMRAISSEAYLWLATDDVLASCCSLVKDLRKLIEMDELEFVEVYRILEANVQRFMARISDMAWRSEEFNALMASKNHCETVIGNMSSPRIQMALNSHMRQFACTANVQTTMKSIFRAAPPIWFSVPDWYNIGNNRTRDIWRYCRAGLFFPITSLLHGFIPWIFPTFRIPFARFVAHFMSYFLFFVAALIRLSYPTHETPSYLIEWSMYIYIFGLLVEKVILMSRIGLKLFTSFWWRVFDIFLISSFLLSFVFFISVISDREVFEVAEVDRNHWPSFSPELLHEIFFSIACVIGISKIFYYMQLYKNVGGSVISVGKCIGKVYTYLIIMVIVIFSFSVGLNILTSPYNDRINRANSEEGSASQTYGHMETSVKNLFWSIFGYLGPSTYTYTVGNAGPNNEPVNHVLHSFSLEVLGALYHGIIIITLMNLMTSLLVKKADEVLDNEEMEFKYTRATIYSEFIAWEMGAPPPFNLALVVFHPIWDFFEKRLAYRGPDDGSTERMNQAKFMETMRLIFDRFCASKECKYKSVWRSEYDKEASRPARVQYLFNVVNPRSLDNTYNSKKNPFSEIPGIYPRRRMRRNGETNVEIKKAVIPIPPKK